MHFAPEQRHFSRNAVAQRLEHSLGKREGAGDETVTKGFGQIALVAQWLEHSLDKRGVASSTLARRTKLFVFGH